MVSGLTAEAFVGIGAYEPIFGAVMPTLAVPLIATAATVVVLGLAALALGWYIVRTTGKTEGLLHLAELVRAILRRR